MADGYWDHPSRRETKRLIDLADAGAILDELQNQTTEWDDAREALDRLVRGANAGPTETAAAITADPMTREKLRDLLSDMECGAGPDGGDIMSAVDDLIAQERDAARAEVALADRARDNVRKDNLEADRTLTDALKEHVPPQRRPTLVKAATEAAGLIRRQAAEMERLRAERDRLAEQVERDRASIIRLAQSWARRGKGAVAAELLTEFEIDEGEILGEAGR